MSSKKITPLKVIRRKCLDCTAGSYKEIRDCLIPDCALYPYRMGKRPKLNNRRPDFANSTAEK